VADRETMISEYLPKHAIVAEVGVFQGHNARTILKSTAPRELHLIDRDFSILQRQLLEPEFGQGIVGLHEDDSRAALMSFPDGYFNWIYIDADRSYCGVKRDVDAAKRKLKPEGLLVVHNYMFFSHNDLVPVGFVHAVNELCVAEDWSLRYIALHSRMYCDVAVARMGFLAGNASALG
jgi:hypothetical protein